MSWFWRQLRRAVGDAVGTSVECRDRQSLFPPHQRDGLRGRARGLPYAAAMSPPPLPPPVVTPWHGSWVGKSLLAIALVFLVKEAQPVLVPVAIAIVLTFVLARPQRVLHRLGLPQVAAAALLVIALIGGVVLMAGSLAMPAAKWWERAPTNVAQLLEQWERVRSSLPLLGRPLAAPVVVAPPLTPANGEPRRSRTPSAQAIALQKMNEEAAAKSQASADNLGSRIAEEGIALTRVVLTRFMSFGVSAAATVMLLFFLLCSEHWIVSRAVEALPKRRTRAVVLLAVRRAQRDIGHFFGTMAIINAGVGVITGCVVWMLGLENPVLWGTLAAVLNFIPYLGPAIAVGLLGLGGVLSFTEVIDMAAPALAFLAIHFIESNIVTPTLIGRRLALSPVVVFASLMWMGWLWGVAGAMLTVPLLIGLRCGLHAARSTRRWSVMLEGSSDGVPTLSSLLKFKRRRAAAAAAARR